MDALHVALLANLQGALCALLRAAQDGVAPDAVPDSVSADLETDGLELTYWRKGVPVAAEGL